MIQSCEFSWPNQGYCFQGPNIRATFCSALGAALVQLLWLKLHILCGLGLEERDAESSPGCCRLCSICVFNCDPQSPLWGSCSYGACLLLLLLGASRPAEVFLSWIQLSLIWPNSFSLLRYLMGIRNRSKGIKWKRAMFCLLPESSDNCEVYIFHCFSK